MRVSELEGALLDAAVAKALGYGSSSRVPDELCGTWYAGECDGGVNEWSPSTNWLQGGQIIDSEPFGIFEKDGDTWSAGLYRDGVCVAYESGPTLLVAAMRAFVASRFGDEVK